MVFVRLKKYLRKYRSQYFYGFAALILTSLTGVAVPYLLKFPIDTLKSDGATRAFYMWIAMFLVACALNGVFRYYMRRILIGISRKIEYDFRNDYFSHLQKLTSSFYHRTRTGDIMARGTNDINAVRNVLGPGIMYSSYTIIYTTFAVIMMVQIDLKLTLLALAPFPVVAFGVQRLVKSMYRLSDKVQSIFSDVTTRAEENFSGIRVIKAYRQEKHQIERFSAINKDYLAQNIRLSKLRGAMFAGITFLAGLGFAIILYFGGRDVILNRFTLGGFVSFNTYLSTLIWPMISIGWVINIFQMASASLSRIERIMDEEPEIRNDDRTDFDIKEMDGSIEFDNVSFKYENSNQETLIDINLRIQPGMFVAVVGATGSGKSSLVNLLARLYDTQKGRILLGGHDIRRIPLSVLHANVGFVPQEDFLFSDTIASNIAFGDGIYDRSAMEQIAKSVHIANEIEHLEEGYDTLLGERGINLSGGQKQRVAIARAAFGHPKILILDDALSAVDTFTESRIMHSLKSQFAESTKIIVSHRVTTLTDADLIVVIDEGRIIESGIHSQLLSNDGKYADLYYKQLIQEELEQIE